MKQETLKINLINELTKIMPQNEAQSEIDFILTEHLHLKKTELLLNPTLINKYKQELEKIVKKRVSTREPLQYILSKASFYGETYYVDKNVLIPRPETELLVQEVLAHATKESKILDIGTGSGCIAVTLAKELNSNNITGADVSAKALDVARKNALTICPNLNISFVESNLFENINDKFDIIVSNPPYISYELKKDMEPEVLKYEPHSALFAEDKGLCFYRAIIKSAHNYLNTGGFIAFELGVNQAEEVAQILNKESFEKIRIVTDFSHIDRIITACYNSERKGN